MSWFTDANCEAESLKEHVRYARAVDFDFPSGHSRFWTGLGDLTIGGDVYTGTGSLGSVSDTSENVSLANEQWTYRLSGVDPTILPESEIDNSYGRSVTEYEVWIHPTQLTVIGTEIFREGCIGPIKRLDGHAPYIQVRCYSRLAFLDEAEGWRFTTEHHEEFFASDLGCDFTRQMDSVELIWGGYKVFPGFHGLISDVVRESQRQG